MDTIFVIMRPDGTPFHRDDAMGILATDSEAQAIRFQHAREDEGAEYVRYTRNQPPAGASQSSNPNPVTPGLSSESGALVSERARDIVAELTFLYTSGYLHGHHDTVEGTFVDVAYVDRFDYLQEDAEEVLAGREFIALEQALTQQRGEADAWIFHFKDDDGAVFVRLCHSRSDIERAIINDWWNGDDAVADDGERMAPHIVDDLVRTGVFHAEDGSCYAQKVTTPQPGAEALREYIFELRGRADTHELNGLHACSVGMKDAADRHDEKAKLQRGIADELESLLGKGG